MLTRKTATIAALAAALMTTVLVGTGVADRFMADATAVAVVDVERVFNELKEREAIEADLQGRAEQLKQQEQERAAEINRLRADLDILVPGNPNYESKLEELERKALEFQAWRQFHNQKLNRERGTEIEMLYRKMLDSIGRVASQQGFDLVLFKEKPADFRNAKPEALPTLIQVRKVLWSKDALDLTDQTIVSMNNDFANMN